MNPLPLLISRMRPGWHGSVVRALACTQRVTEGHRFHSLPVKVTDLGCRLDTHLTSPLLGVYRAQPISPPPSLSPIVFKNQSEKISRIKEVHLTLYMFLPGSQALSAHGIRENVVFNSFLFLSIQGSC